MKKALLTTTALVALSGVASAHSVGENSGGTSHHTHAPTIVFHGNANINYTIPLKTAAGATPDGTIGSDVDLDVTMTSAGQYSAKISYGLENVTTGTGGIGNATVEVGTPFATIYVGQRDANGGADASDMFSEVGDMSGIGTDEDNTDWYIKLPFGGWTVAASGYANDSAIGTCPSTTLCTRAAGGQSENTSIGLSGTVGGLTITAGGMGDSGGASVSTNLMGATVKVAAANMMAGGTNTQETGIAVSIPMGGMTLDIDSSTTATGDHWGVSATAPLAGVTVTVGTGSDENNKFKAVGNMSPNVKFHLEYESDTTNLTFDPNDPTIEAGVTYTVPGTQGTTISASYSNDDDDFDAGTQVKMAFNF
jgi:hypothetical protein